MKGITKTTLKTFLRQAEHMYDTIRNGVYGETDFKPSDFEQQHKHIRIALPVIMGCLVPLIDGLRRLVDKDMPLVENDNKDHEYRYLCTSTIDSYTTDCPEEALQWLSEQLRYGENKMINVFDNHEHIIKIEI